MSKSLAKSETVLLFQGVQRRTAHPEFRDSLTNVASQGGCKTFSFFIPFGVITFFILYSFGGDQTEEKEVSKAGFSARTGG